MISVVGHEPSSYLRRALDELQDQHRAGAGGRQLARRRADVVDLALISLFRQAEHDTPSDLYGQAGLAVVAVGGYGRRELSPFSDVDLMLLYASEEQERVESVAESLFYPLWDAGLELGHGARTVDECLDVAEDNLELLTSFFQSRLLVGDQRLFSELIRRLQQSVARDGGIGFVDSLRASRRERHDAFGDAHVLLEPHLKEGRGGLRDVHEVLWLAFGLRGTVEQDGLSTTGWLPQDALVQLEQASDTLLRARTSLHYAAGRKVDRAYFDYQADLAGHFRAPGEQTPADRVMARVSEAAESIAVVAEAVWEGIEATGPQSSWAFQIDEAAKGPERASARPSELLTLLRGGRAALPALERLSNSGVLSSWIPGWEGVRFLGQRESFHTYTVGGHSLRCVATAASPEELAAIDPLAGTLAEGFVGTPELDALLLACLLHDVGKGLDGEDHAQTGAPHAARVTAGLGLPPHIQELVAFLVRHHLLLPDTASRRDIDDPVLLSRIADEIGDQTRLELLYLLTVADSTATGRAVWTPWTATLVRELLFKLEAELGSSDRGAAATRAGVGAVEGEGSSTAPGRVLSVDVGAVGGEVRFKVAPGALEGVQELTVAASPLPGLLARVSGVLAYHGITILSAAVHQEGEDTVAYSFRVSDYFEKKIPDDRWALVATDLGRALEGRMSLDHRLAEKAARYPIKTPAERMPETRVVVENAASDALTVIEVHVPDRVGLLYTLARTLDDLMLDVRLAKVSTLKDRAVDVFYVADARGHKLVDPDHQLEVERAVLFALSRGDVIS